MYAHDNLDAETLPAFQIALPPGITGCLAQEFMEMQHYKNQTLAVMWAMHIVSGFAQRYYHVGGVGLNTYIMNLAETGFGKERQVEARIRLEHAINNCSNYAIDFSKFHGPSEFSSGVALLNHVMKHKRSASIINEASFLFEAMGAGTNEHVGDLKRRMLALRTKAGPDGRVESKVYADASKNIEACDSPALSLLCEGQPARFYASLTPEAAADGLCNRFEIINASARKRGARNRNPRAEFSSPLAQRLRLLVEKTNSEVGPGQTRFMTAVQVDEQAQALFDQYEGAVIDALHIGNDKIKYEIFARSLVSARVYAALLATVENPFVPTINYEQAFWSLELIYRERNDLLRMFNENAIGKDSSTRKSLLIKALRQLKGKHSARSKLTGQQHSAGMLQFFVLADKLGRLPAFKDSAHFTTNHLIRESLQELIAEGALIKLDSTKMYDGIQPPAHGENYKILDLEQYK